MDAFSAQIVKFVRAMPDAALLELVKQKLGVLGVPGVAPAPRAPRGGARSNDRKTSGAAVPTPARPGGAADARKAGRGKRPAASRRKAGAPPRTAVSADRQGVLDKVEQVVKAGSGVSASDVASAAGIPQTRAAAALKELKLARRIFQGGDRRFARYAGDARTAEQASVIARKNAKGPEVRPGKASPRKRPPAAAPGPAST